MKFTPPTLFRRPDSPYWHVRVTNSCGRRVRRTTRKINPSSAIEYAELLVREFERRRKEGRLI